MNRPDNPNFRWEDIYDYKDSSHPVNGTTAVSNTFTIPAGTLLFRYFNIIKARSVGVTRPSATTEDFASFNTNFDKDKRAYIYRNIVRNIGTMDTMEYNGNDTYTTGFTKDKKSYFFCYTTPNAGFGVQSHNIHFNAYMVYMTTVDLCIANPMSTISDDVILFADNPSIHNYVNSGILPPEPHIDGSSNLKDKKIRHRNEPAVNTNYVDLKFKKCNDPSVDPFGNRGKIGESCFEGASVDVCLTRNYVNQCNMSGQKSVAGPDSLFIFNTDKATDVSMLTVETEAHKAQRTKMNNSANVVKTVATTDYLCLNSDRKRTTTNSSIFLNCVNVTPAELAIIPLGNHTTTAFDEADNATTVTSSCKTYENKTIADISALIIKASPHLVMLPIGIGLTTSTDNFMSFVPILNVRTIPTITQSANIPYTPMAVLPLTKMLASNTRMFIHLMDSLAYNVQKQLFYLRINDQGHNKPYECNSIDLVTNVDTPYHGIMKSIPLNKVPGELTYLTLTDFINKCFVHRILAYAITVSKRHLIFNKCIYRLNANWTAFCDGSVEPDMFQEVGNDLICGHTINQLHTWFQTYTPARANPEIYNAILTDAMTHTFIPDPCFTAMFPPDTTNTTDSTLGNDTYKNGNDYTVSQWMSRFTSMLFTLETGDYTTWSPQLIFMMRFTAFLKYCDTNDISIFDLESPVLLVPTGINSQNYLDQIMPIGPAPDDGDLSTGPHAPIYINNYNPTTVVHSITGTPIIAGKRTRKRKMTRKKRTKRGGLRVKSNFQRPDFQSDFQKPDVKKDTLNPLPVTENFDEVLDIIRDIIQKDELFKTIRTQLKKMNISNTVE
jgi:hypothetical protein